jgi:hypothetical protein
MKHVQEKLRNANPRSVDRLMLRMSTSRHVDGLWVGTFEGEAEPVLRRVDEALCLIKTYDRIRYDRLLRDLKRIWVKVLFGNLGCFNYALWACELDTRFVLDETSSPEVIASAIVHEATHARLWRCGIGYDEEFRHRVEAICFRRELAFAAKLPSGEQLRENAQAKLEGYSPTYWTNAAFAERSLEGEKEAMRYLGFPEWLLRTLLAMRALRIGVCRFTDSLARRP